MELLEATDDGSVIALPPYVTDANEPICPALPPAQPTVRNTRTVPPPAPAVCVQDHAGATVGNLEACGGAYGVEGDGHPVTSSPSGAHLPGRSGAKFIP